MTVPLVVAAHRVVMDTLCARRMLLVVPPSFQAPSPSSSIVDEFNSEMLFCFEGKPIRHKMKNHIQAVTVISFVANG